MNRLLLQWVKRVRESQLGRRLRGLYPAGLAGRFALVTAGVAAVAVILLSLGSWSLINRQHDEAERQIALREREFHARTVAANLKGLAGRMAEVAGSTILASGLVDSSGRETYLAPFLNGVRHVGGIPVSVRFSDFEGKEILSNNGAAFTAGQLEWLRSQLNQDTPRAAVFEGMEGAELVGLEPLRYPRTNTPEGGLLYKIRLADIPLEDGFNLVWGSRATAEKSDEAVLVRDVPPVYAPLGFAVRGTPPGAHALLLPELQVITVFVIAFAVFVVLLLVGRRLARLLTADLQGLESFSSRMMASGLSESRAPETGSAEVASLARSINQMLDRLSEQQGALRHEGEKLASAAEALRLADQRKDEFLAMLAHELRNPLAPIATGAELLKRASGADDRVRRTSEVIVRQVRHMTQIVDDLLDVSRVTRGLVGLHPVAVDLHDVVAQAVDQVRPYCDERGHALTLTLPEAPLPVYGDPARLVQVLSNLLQNAAKYTPGGGRIGLSVEEAGDWLQVRVQDNGIGIAPEFMPEIFGLFTQGVRTPDRSQGGLGLGLPLVKHLVELHGGRVSAYSAGTGQGTTMTVRLPRARGDAPAAPGARPAGAPEAGNAHALKVMVVDDNADAAQTLATVLELEGHEVRLALSAPSALALLASFMPDVFILDIGLPGMDGYELARRLRQHPRARRARLIALTGYGQDVDRQRSADAGFDQHLVKPIDALTLTRALEQAPVLN